MPDPARPPAQPRPHFGRLPAAGPERSFRLQLGAALLLGVVLVATGFYLWRRPPRAPAEARAAADAPSASASPGEEAARTPVEAVDAGRALPVVLSDARVLGCHDRGPRKTPADQCDHLSPIEKALANAVEQSASCIAPAEPATSRGRGPEAAPRDHASARSAGGGAGAAGTIEYVADVSFLRHKVSVLLPRSGRSVRDRRVLAACATAVRGAMGGVPLEGVDHQHARYQIAVTATYPPRQPDPGLP